MSGFQYPTSLIKIGLLAKEEITTLACSSFPISSSNSSMVFIIRSYIPSANLEDILMLGKSFKKSFGSIALLLGSFLELRKMGYTQEEINWAYNTMSGNFVPNFNIKYLSNLIESRKEN